MQRLMKQFSNPEIEIDRRLVLIILGFSLIAVLLLYIFDISRESVIFLAIGLSVAIIQAWRGNLKFAGWFAPFSGLVIFAILMFNHLGIRDTALLGLPVVIVAGSLLNGRRGILIFGLASLGIVIALHWAEINGLMDASPDIRNTLSDYIVVSVVIILTAIVQWTVISRLDEKNQRANQELLERKQAEARLRHSEDLYRRAIDAAGAVPYYRDLRTNTYTFMGEGILQMTGYSAEEMTPALWESIEQEGFPRGKLAGLTYEEADRLTDANAAYIWECDYRIRTRDGQTRWVADTSVVGYDENGQQAGVVGILQDITERKQAQQQIEQRLQELAAIHAVSQAAASQLEMDSLFDLVARELFQLFNIHQVYFALHDPEKNQVNFPYYRHGDRRIQTEPVPFGQGLSSRVIMSRQPLLINENYEQRSAELGVVRFMQTADNLSKVSWLGVPIQAGEKVIGMACVMNLERENAFTENDVRLLTTIAASVGIAIQNSRLYMTVQQELAERKQAEEKTNRVNLELQQRIRELYVLNSVAQAGADSKSEDELLESVVETLYHSIYPDIVGVALWDEQAQLLRTHPYANRGIPAAVAQPQMTARPHEGIVGEVAATRQPYRLKDTNDPLYIGLDPSIRSELCVPILAGEKLVGVLDVESRQENAFGEADEHLLMTIAGQLASALERLRAENDLRNLNAELELRVRHRTAELETVNKELEAFSYSVSHDLRAPLRAITSFTRIIKNDFSAAMDPTAVGFFDRVLTAGEKMNRLIDDLLEFSRTGRKPLNKQTVDMLAVVRAVVESLAPETENRQIEWTITEMPSAQADPVLIQQIYANLIGNAIKYSRNKIPARITISSMERDGETIYFVSDNGAGFDMQYAEKLFGVFQRLHSESEFEGTGIGLATVQRIIHRHGGRIWAEAEPDKGATFYFTLG